MFVSSIYAKKTIYFFQLKQIKAKESYTQNCCPIF